MQQGVNADGLPLTKSVGFSVQMSTRVRPLLRRQVRGEVMRDLRRRNLHRTTGRSPRSCYRRLGGGGVVLLVRVVLAYVAVGHCRRLVAVVFAQSCEGGSIADKSKFG